MIETTYTQARANFAKLCEQVVEDREIVYVRRRNAEDVAIVSADELEGLMETAHLLRSPRNARRLLAALLRAGEDSVPAATLDGLRAEIGLEDER